MNCKNLLGVQEGKSATLDLKMSRSSLVKAWNMAAAEPITLDELFERICQAVIEKDRAESIIDAGKIVKFPLRRR